MAVVQTESLLFRVPIPRWAPSLPPADGKRAETNQEANSPGDSAESRLLSLAGALCVAGRSSPGRRLADRPIARGSTIRSDPGWPWVKCGLGCGTGESGLSRALTLDRPTRTLSGGETGATVNLTASGHTPRAARSFVLDEPSVGLCIPATQPGWSRILHKYSATPGTPSSSSSTRPAIMRAADRIVDLGPGPRRAGRTRGFPWRRLKN